jgi:predicted NUDIX family NTP pyrophosphohydrolase
MNEATVGQRQLQTRIFETSDESKILSASASLLQDLGYTLDKSETKVGLIVASKGAVVMTALFGVSACTYDEKQKIRASVVTHPASEGGGRMAVRVTFQRIVWSNRGIITKLERLNDSELYAGFFDKLSKAVFLEAHEI